MQRSSFASDNTLNPLKRVNSILTIINSPRGRTNNHVSIPLNGSIQFLQYYFDIGPAIEVASQSPQTGQFNSYDF